MAFPRVHHRNPCRLPLQGPPVKKDSPSPRAVHRHRKPGKVPGALPVRISVELTLSNGLHILQKDLDYPGLYRLIQKLEVLC